MRHFDHKTFIVSNVEMNYRIRRWLRDKLGPQGVRWNIDLFIDPGHIIMVEFDSSGQQFLFELQFAEKIKFITDPDKLRSYYLEVE